MNTSINLSTSDKLLTATIFAVTIVALCLVAIPFATGYLPKEPAMNLTKMVSYSAAILWSLYGYGLHFKYSVNKKASKINAFLSKIIK